MGLKLENQGAIGADSSKKAREPGPGNYDGDYHNTVKKSPSFSIKGRYAPSKRLNVPGPGSYQKSLVDKKMAPSYGFGSSQQR